MRAAAGIAILLLLLLTLPLLGARRFNGSSDIASANAQIGSPIYLVGGTKITLAGWIYLPAVPASQANPFGKGTQSNNTEQYYFDISAPGHANQLGVHFFQSTPLNHNVDLWWTTPLTANTWYAIAATWSSTSGFTRLYVNGAQVNFVISATGTLAGSGVGIPNWCFGGFASTGIPGVCNNSNFAGAVAEVGVWADDLTANQVLALARGASPSTIAAGPHGGKLVGYWPLWGAASPEPDLSGNALGATVTGTTTVNHAPVEPLQRVP